MQSNPSGSEKAAFQRLIRKSIPDGHPVNGQIDGLGRLIAAVAHALEPMIGMVAARATLSRATTVVGRQHPRLPSPRQGWPAWTWRSCGRR